MKLSALALFTALVFCNNSSAQKGIKGLLYGGVGFMKPSTYMNNHSLLKTGVNFRGGYFQSFVAATNKLKPGVEVRLDYSKFPADVLPAYTVPYRFNNGGTPETINLLPRIQKKKPDAFQYLIGPSLLLCKAAWMIQPSLLFGYASISQEKFNLYNTLADPSNPTQSQQVIFYYGEHETNNGFVFVPSLKGGYRLTNRLAAFISLDYSFGTAQEFGDFELDPQGNPVNGMHQYSEIVNGTFAPVTRKSKYRIFSMSLNLAYTFTARN